MLQLDQAGHYGSAWGSLTLEQFLSWAKQQAEATSSAESTQSPCRQEFVAHTAEATKIQSLLQVGIPDDQAMMYSNFELYQQPVDLGSSREFSLDLAGKAGDPICFWLIHLRSQEQGLVLLAESDSSQSVGVILCI